MAIGDTDPWHWLGDGEDHLESLGCPILIEAYDFRAELEKARREERDAIFDEGHLSESIEDFMSQQPGDDDREWSSVDMARYIIGKLGVDKEAD